MRPLDSNIKQQGQLGGSKIALSIDVASMKFIMQHLTNLYSDQALAVIREYSTNALDSHVEAGNSAPIEVTGPTRLSPYFIVRDFGVGLDEEGITEVYSKYGASTKRDTDSQVGMLGFGCKAGLTYTDQLLITGWKNGKKYSAVLKREQDESASIQIVDVRDSSEPTGVEIKIMVKDQYSFTEKMNEFYKFWSPGTVLVNGTAPEGFKGMDKLAEGLYLDPQSRGDYVVMGNVPYRTSIPSIYKNRSYRYSYSIVAIAPVGSVSFPPSREELMTDARTTAWIKDASKRFDNALLDKVRKDIEGASGAGDALKKPIHWQNTLGSLAGEMKYKGNAVPYAFMLDDPNPTRIGVPYNRSEISGKSFMLNSDIVQDMFIESLADIKASRVIEYNPKTLVVITGWTMKKFTSLHARKVRLYLEKLGLCKAPTSTNQMGLSSTNIKVVVSRNPKVNEGGFLDDYATLLTWSDIADMKLPRVAKVKTPTLHIHTKSGDGLAFVDDKAPIFYVKGAWNHVNTRLSNKAWIYKYLPADAQVVMLTERRVPKFVKDYPTAERLSDKLLQAAQLYVATLPQGVLDTLAASEISFAASTLRARVAKIADPDLAAELKKASNSTSEWQAFVNERSSFTNAGITLTPYLPTKGAAGSRSSAFEKRYPLLPHLSWSTEPALIEDYINTIYNTKFNTNRKAV